MSERRPDYLAAEARRWIGHVGYATEPSIIRLVLAGLRRYYDDLVVVEGIVRWKLERSAGETDPPRVLDLSGGGSVESRPYSDDETREA